MANSSGIEIVIRGCSVERTATWLNAIAGPFDSPTDAGGALVFATRIGQVVVQPNMEGPGGVGVWFNSNTLPWASPAACARQAAHDLECVVWCEPGDEFPEVHPLSPVFLEVNGIEERLIVPPDGE